MRTTVSKNESDSDSDNEADDDTEDYIDTTSSDEEIQDLEDTSSDEEGVANDRAQRPRTTLGERLCQMYLPSAQLRYYIRSHRRALGILLVAPHTQDRRQRYLRPKLLKRAHHLLKSK